MHDTHNERMSGGETRAAGGLALVFAFRMLGMFMVLPVLATYGMDLAGATPALIGLAIGAYGLTQAAVADPVRHDFRPHRPSAGDLPGAGDLRPGQRAGGPGRFDLGA